MHAQESRLSGLNAAQMSLIAEVIRVAAVVMLPAQSVKKQSLPSWAAQAELCCI
jgi:hypothetical protein